MRLFLIISLIVFQQSNLRAQHATPSPRKILTDFYKGTNPETINIHMDRSAYLKGETIYYRLNLVNHPYLSQQLSAVIYVELKDTTQKVLVRQKVRAHLGKVVGSLLLPRGLPSGKYILSTFTLWMKSSGLHPSETQFVIGDSKSHSSRHLSNHSENSYITIIENSVDRLEFSVQHDTIGKITLHQKGKTYLDEQFVPKEKDRFVLTSPPYGGIGMTMWDLHGRPLWERTITVNGKKQYEIKASFSKEKYRVRDYITINLDAFDQYDQPLLASISISVTTQKPHQSPASNETIPFSVVLAKPPGIQREMLVYPQHVKALHPLAFSRNDVQAISETELSSAARIDTSNAINMRWREKIYADYGKPVEEIKLTDYNLPYDDEYVVSEYPTLTTIKELLRDIAPNVRIADRKNRNDLRIVNFEERGKVFRYPDTPLLLIDGVICSDVSEFSNMHLQGLEKINVIWKSNTINRSALGPLAANGIISAYSHDGSFLTTGKEGQKDSVAIFSTFSKPAIPVYSAVEAWNEQFPDVRDPIYWNPDITFRKKTKITFRASDESGEYHITIKGITQDGILIDEHMSIPVF